MATEFTVDTFPYDKIKYCKSVSANGRPTKSHMRSNIKNIVNAFDIETTALQDIKHSFMYVWQWYFDGIGIVFGRSWDEFIKFCKNICIAIEGKTVKLVTYVHNLSYEFAFLKGIYHFTNDEVFATQSRKVLKISMYEKIEFRCSYMLSNCSLDTYCEKMHVKHKKIKGFEYSKIRYPWTPLTDFEKAYCGNDVIGLVEALKAEMTLNGDNIATIPYTSTGYVRRDVKRAMRGYNHNKLRSLLPNAEVMIMLREAFRGGNTHANRYFSGRIVENVKSVDRCSSYPDVQLNCQYPMTPFRRLDADAEILELFVAGGKAVLTRLELIDVECHDNVSMPYLPISKCTRIGKYISDNGRVLKADTLCITVTDIDYKIILNQYTIGKIIVHDTFISDYGMLPKQCRDVTMSYYRDKTELKDVEGQEVYYAMRKAMLNSVYGMSAQFPLNDVLEFIEDKHIWNLTHTEITQENLDKAYRKAFFSYAWGCWCTAHARRELQECIDLFDNAPIVNGHKPHVVYCDTDSIKYIGEMDFTAYNNKCIERDKINGAFATDKHGKVIYLGIFEQEKTASQFKTLGAKKYVGVYDGKLKATIAGVVKDHYDDIQEKVIGGASELSAQGGIKSFKEGFIFTESGGLESTYNDNVDMYIDIDGHKLHITDNIYLSKSCYTLGITADYEKILERVEEFTNGNIFRDWLS